MKQKLNLLVLFGGQSSEHHVSCLSAASILHHMNRDRIHLLTVGITEAGRWILTQATPEQIADGSWVHSSGNRGGVLSPDRTQPGIRTILGESLPVDCVFPVLHGKYGEDGTLQGLLDLAGIPYVGSGVLASAACMDKAVTKSIIDKTGIRQAAYATTDRYRFASGPTEVIRDICNVLQQRFPLFVKPVNAGSSVGISKVWDSVQLFDGIRIAAKEDHKILVEEGISGRELEVAILGNRKPQASLVGEIIASNEFYDYEAKYINSTSRTEIVKDLSESKIHAHSCTGERIWRRKQIRGSFDGNGTFDKGYPGQLPQPDH